MAGIKQVKYNTMALVRLYAKTLAGTYPNKTLTLTDNRTSTIAQVIEQNKISRVETTFIEQTSDPLDVDFATTPNNLVPTPVIVPSANGDADRYVIENVTKVTFYYDNGDEFALELQHTDDADWNGGDETDLQAFLTDWYA